MRKFFNDGGGYYALTASGFSREEFWSIIDEAAAECNLRGREATPASTNPTESSGRDYFSEEQVRPFRVVTDLQTQLAIFPAYDDETDSDEADRLFSFIKAVSIRAGVVLGRSFHPVSPTAAVDSELTGALSDIQWVQYWGPSIVARIGVEKVLAAPAYYVKALPDGACILRLSLNPNDGFGRKAAADYFGIELKPMHVRFGDRLIEIPPR